MFNQIICFQKLLKRFQKVNELFNYQDPVDSENSRNTARFNKNSKERAREIQDTANLS